MVRVPSDEPITIKRILDTGAQSLMIPNIDDADQARRAVAATRYAPRGVRGFSQAPRAARFGRIPDYHARCEAEIFVAIQIESRRALDNLEEIAGVEGVDGVFIGPGDLSTSLGYLGQQNHPDVVAIIEDTIARIRSPASTPASSPPTRSWPSATSRPAPASPRSAPIWACSRAVPRRWPAASAPDRGTSILTERP